MMTSVGDFTMIALGEAQAISSMLRMRDMRAAAKRQLNI